MKQFKDCLAIIPRLRKPGISVEHELAELQEEAKTFPHVYRELVAVRYYLPPCMIARNTGAAVTVVRPGFDRQLDWVLGPKSSSNGAMVAGTL
jgi:hypothetical protein